ncbi:hypothetical protein [Fluviicola sp.]|uniref:hypothetical protein n=1 Tax=Fluviicola sp. TaxID=1917219 RepID=UPI002634B637|nr:hypothetical protein [Fluviicola sp.]
MKIKERYQSTTPKFFRVVRTIGLCLVAVGGVLVASPVTIPTEFVSFGGYLLVAGSVATAVAQATSVDEEK